jgi:hypothetical protein
MENRLGSTLGTWGIYSKPDGNPLGTEREQIGNQGETEKWGCI